MFKKNYQHSTAAITNPADQEPGEAGALAGAERASRAAGEQWSSNTAAGPARRRARAASRQAPAGNGRTGDGVRRERQSAKVGGRGCWERSNFKKIPTHTQDHGDA